MSGATVARNLLDRMGLNRHPDGALTPAQVDSNIRHLVTEVAFYGFLTGCAINFMQVYVVRLGASGLLVGAVTYGPALVSVFWHLPAARLMQRRGHRMGWVLASGFLHRFAYFLVAMLPLFFSQWLAEFSVVVLVLQAIPLSLASTSFLSMLADAVPPERMSQTLSWRIAATGLTTTLGTLLAGPLLLRLPFPMNYQILFCLGFLASLVSAWQVSRVVVADHPPVMVSGANWNRDLRTDLHVRGFLPFLGIVCLLQLTIGMVTPLLPIYWVRELGATDAQISLVVTLYSAAMVIGSLMMRRILRRLGKRGMLMAGAIGYALYPLLVAFTHSIWWLLPWAALGGFFNAAITVTLIDILVAITPDRDRTRFVAIYNIFVSVALFLGPLTAGLMAPVAGGVRLGLIVAGGAGLLAGIAVALWMRGQPE
jgi:MFS family permease